MKSLLPKLLTGILACALLALFVLHFAVLPYSDKKRNAVLTHKHLEVPEGVRNFHRAAFVVDMHADTLMWGRDLTHRQSRGHIDLPRLNDGGVDLQVFSVVTQVPSPLKQRSNSGDTDSLPLLFLASWRHAKTWFDPKERALAQAREFSQLADSRAFTRVLIKSDLDEPGLKGLLSLEGMHALEDGGEDSLVELYNAGFRMMGLTHFIDTEVAGSFHGIKRHGLTPLGRTLIRRMEAMGITIDLAHASSAAINETLAIASKPVVVSHAGVFGVCPGRRNLTDEQLRSIARNGGVVGIGYWEGFVCNNDVRGITEAILYAVKVAGIDHVGLGSDFDGNIETRFDASELPLLTQALLASGLSEPGVKKILGGNAHRVLYQNLPEQ